MDKRVEIAGQVYRLCYSVNALCDVERLAGGSLDMLMERQFSACRLLLWGALREHQGGITLEGAGEIITRHIRMGGTLEDIVNICAEALSEAGFFSQAAMEEITQA